MKGFVGAIFVLVGIIAIAGSGNDCDGKCMEYANSIGEMLKIMFFGILSIAFGSYLVYSNNE